MLSRYSVPPATPYNTIHYTADFALSIAPPQASQALSRQKHSKNMWHRPPP